MSAKVLIGKESDVRLVLMGRVTPYLLKPPCFKSLGGFTQNCGEVLHGSAQMKYRWLHGRALSASQQSPRVKLYNHGAFLNRAQPVGDHDHCDLALKIIDRFHHLRLGVVVECAGCFIENE